MHYLFYDCETGGFYEDQHSLLTAYFAVYSEDFVLIDDLYLQLKPENLEDLKYEAGALGVNNIDIDEHINSPDTITYAEGKEKVLDLLNRNKIKGKRKHFTPSGHNIDFDNKFIWKQLISQEEWEKIVHYHQMDTVTFGFILKTAGLIPPRQSLKLTDLAGYYNIPVIDAHNARGDIKMNVEVCKKMIKSLTDLKKNAVGISSDNLLKIIED